jgi:flagellar biosynthesis protein
MGKKAVALRYNGSAPKIIAQARGKLLEKMLYIAEKNSIPVYQDSDLAEMLFKLPAGSEIPEKLFRAVAEVFAFCYRVNESFKNKLDSGFIENG